MNYDCGVHGELLKIYKPYEIAKYIRLSLADEETGKSTDESESVTNQRRLMKGLLIEMVM